MKLNKKTITVQKNIKVVPEVENGIEVERLRIAHKVCSDYANSRSPWGYACLRSIQKIKDVLEPFEQEVQDKRKELALTNEETGEYLLTEKGGYRFSKECSDTIGALITEQGKRKVAYEPYFATDFTPIRNEIAKLDALNGIVVNIDLKEYVNRKNSTDGNKED